MSNPAVQLPWLVIGIVALVLCGVGDVAYVISFVPHAGHHGHAPSTLGYIALYALAPLVLLLEGGLLVFCAEGALDY